MVHVSGTGSQPAASGAPTRATCCELDEREHDRNAGRPNGNAMPNCQCIGIVAHKRLNHSSDCHRAQLFRCDVVQDKATCTLPCSSSCNPHTPDLLVVFESVRGLSHRRQLRYCGNIPPVRCDPLAVRIPGYKQPFCELEQMRSHRAAQLWGLGP